MIHFEDFSLMGPPRTGRGWFLAAAAECGLDWAGPDMEFDQATADSFTLTIVRCPFTWLRSIYFNQPPKRYFKVITVLNQIVHYASVSSTFPQFIDSVCSSEGIVGRMWDQFPAANAIRLEDFPWAVVEFFEPMGIESSCLKTIAKLEPINKSMACYSHDIEAQAELKRKIIQSEKAFCEQYNYY